MQHIEIYLVTLAGSEVCVCVYIYIYADLHAHKSHKYSLLCHYSSLLFSVNVCYSSRLFLISSYSVADFTLLW